MKQGYRTIENGIQLTHELKNGEFGLHNIYYNSLLNVNGNIKKYPELQQTLDLYNKMAKARSTVYSSAKKSGFFTTEELKYISGVYANISKAADGDLKELQQLTTDGGLKMGDDQRLARVDGVYKRILQKFKVLTAFDNRIIITLNGRKSQQQNAAILKKLYGL